MYKDTIRLILALNLILKIQDITLHKSRLLNQQQIIIMHHSVAIETRQDKNHKQLQKNIDIILKNQINNVYTVKINQAYLGF